MIARLFSPLSVLIATLLCVSPLAVAGQSPATNQPQAAPTTSRPSVNDLMTAVPAGWTPPKTAWGDPDLQGIWSYGTLTPLERPPSPSEPAPLYRDSVETAKQELLRPLLQGDRRGTLTPAEIEKIETAQRTGFDQTGPYDFVWLDVGRHDGRTSLIIDPPSGRRPPLTPAAQKRLAERAAYRKAHPADHWEDLGLRMRCLGSYHGIPPIPTLYGTEYHIVQAPGYVVMVDEEVTGPRRIPTTGRPHLGKDVVFWIGDSRGRWEGNTLVVETTNFRADAGVPPIMDQVNLPTYRVVERFTRIAPDVIELRFTIDDPATYARPWTGLIYMPRLKGPLFEYTCHEGNESLAGALRGAREQEKAAESQKP